MKKLMTAMALVTLAATSTFAANYNQNYNQRVNRTATDSYAAVPFTGSSLVIVDGKVVGADPDANVRLQLQKAQSSDVSE